MKNDRAIRSLKRRLREKFTPDRVRAQTARMNAFWTSSADPGIIPFTLRRRALPLHLPDNFSLTNFTHAARLRIQLEDMVGKAAYEDAYVPALITDDCPYAIPDAFGAPIEVSKGLVVGHPLLQRIDDIGRLAVPDLERPGSLLADHFAFIRFALDAMDGDFYIHQGDVQGPLSIATSLMGAENFYVALCEEPDAVHVLLDLVTTTLIAYGERLIDLVGRERLVPIHCMPFAWRPPGSGIAISEDNLPLISADMFEAFSDPYLSRLGRAFGPIVIHSCGDCRRTIGRVLAKPYICGAQLSQTALADIAVDVPDGKVIVSRNDWAGRDAIEADLRTARDHGIRWYLQIQSLQREFGPDEANTHDLHRWLCDLLPVGPL